MKKFPQLIHVVREGEDDGNGFWSVSESGVFGIDIPGQPIAIYELVKVGTVRIEKSFQDAASSRRGSGRKNR